ncbi:MAG TPA: hypothetical protein VKA27_02725 [Sunxiuqinia sp.]|nr:hypothetical protein [Sunxiuqinia sp.]
MTSRQGTRNNGFAKIILAVVVGFVIVKTCSTSKNERSDRYYQSQTADEHWQKSPLDEIIKSLSDEPNFTVLLYDMNAVEQSSGSTEYKHQYKVLINRPDTVLTRETKWYDVSPAFFKKHIDDMGMELASKKDGVLHKQVAPAGYTNFVGNSQYGHWVDRGGSSFWEFYGRYAFMSSMFHMMTFPAHRAYWNDYYHGYYGGGRAYYGPAGNHIYGTSHYTSSTAGSKSTWGQKSSSFKQNVKSRVSRSVSSSRTRSYSSSSSYSNSRTTRSSSRSSRSSSFRSRGGGFGK